MTRYHRTEGIVLRTYKLGEADRIIVLLTPDKGMVRAVAKGVRKTKSKFGSRLEQTSHIAIQLHIGRSELALITQVETITYFRKIRDDFQRLAKANALLEVIDQIALPDEPAPEMHTMLLRALQSLDNTDSPLLVPSFFLKIMALEGTEPQVNHCVLCAETDLVSFSPSEGGLLCQHHKRGKPISPEAVMLLRNILGGQLSKALNTPESPATKEVDSIASTAIEYFLERKIKSTKILRA
jgi:DNA repair protein RecO (recombination protein O)